MKKIKTLIVEDVLDHVKDLKNKINQINEGQISNWNDLTADNLIEIDLIPEHATNVADAVKLINSTKPDLVFLDISLDFRETAWDVLERVENNFGFVIITAYGEKDNYEKFLEFTNCAFLRKPVIVNELAINIYKVVNSKNLFIYDKETKKIIDSSKDKDFKKFDTIRLRTNEATYFVKINEIVYIQSHGHLSQFHLIDNKENILISRPLKEYEQMFKPEIYNFIRTHNSYLINASYIEKVNYTDMVIFLSNGEQVPLAQRRKDDFKTFINNIYEID